MNTDSKFEYNINRQGISYGNRFIEAGVLLLPSEYINIFISGVVIIDTGLLKNVCNFLKL